MVGWAVAVFLHTNKFFFFQKLTYNAVEYEYAMNKAVNILRSKMHDRL